MKLFWQRDPKWKDIPLGFPKNGQTIGGYGCTITCIGMLVGLSPDTVNNRLQAVKGFSESLVLWSKVGEAIPELTFGWRNYTYDNDKVIEAISKSGGCLVEVDFDGNNQRTDDKHWVLYVGNQKLYDPWTGTVRPTSDYPKQLGYTVFYINNQNDEDMSAQEELDKLKTEYVKLQEEYNKEQQRVTDCRADRENLTNQVNQLQSSYSNLQDDFKRDKEAAAAREKEKDIRHKNFVASLAVTLGTRQDEEEIVAETKRLVDAEDQLNKTRTELNTCTITKTALTSTLENIYEQLSNASGIPVASEKGVPRAIEKIRAYVPPVEVPPEKPKTDWVARFLRWLGTILN